MVVTVRMMLGRDITTIIVFLVIVICIYTTTLPTAIHQRCLRQQDSAQLRQQQTVHASWLLFTTSTSTDFQRRLIIRWSWPALFKNASSSRPNLYDHFFAVESTDPLLRPLLEKENELFGDILIIDMEDTVWNANHLKPFEVLKNVTRGDGWQGRGKYDYVAKIDQDSFIDPVRIWDKYLSSEQPERIMLSMPHEAFCRYPSPQGGFYAMSWDLAEIIGDLYGNMTQTAKALVTQEDCQVGRFPYDAKEPFRFVPMDFEESFDVITHDNGKDGERFLARDWAIEANLRGELKDLQEDVIFLHQMKNDTQWEFVQDLFDQDGWKNARRRAQSMTVRI